MNNKKPELHKHTKAFIERHKINENAGYMLEALLEPAYGELLIAMLVSLMKDKEAIEEFEKFIEDDSITMEGKTIAMVEQLNKSLEGQITTAEIFDGFLEEMIYTIEKNVNKFIKLYNKSREGAATKEEVDENFEGYVNSLAEMNINKIKNETKNGQ